MFERIKEIITPEDVKKILPLSENGKRVKSERDSLLKKIISGLDDRKVMIVGPCSADNEVAVLDYMSRLARISEQV